MTFDLVLDSRRLEGDLEVMRHHIQRLLGSMQYSKSEEDCIRDQEAAMEVIRPLMRITRRGHAVWIRLHITPEQLRTMARSLVFNETLVNQPVEVILTLRHDECPFCHELGVVWVSLRHGTSSGAMTSEGEPIELEAPLCKLYEDGRGCYPGASDKHSFAVNDGSGYLVRFDLYLKE